MRWCRLLLAFLVLGVTIVNPTLKMPAFTQFAGGGGPIIPGTLFPFAFITIACGAISGFHGLIGSGTTPKMITREGDIRVIGYGAMMMESFVAIMAVIAATVLDPGVYFAINIDLGKPAEETVAAMGADPWPYGVEGNRCATWKISSDVPHDDRSVGLDASVHLPPACARATTTVAPGFTFAASAANQPVPITSDSASKLGTSHT